MLGGPQAAAGPRRRRRPGRGGGSWLAAGTPGVVGQRGGTNQLFKTTALRNHFTGVGLTVARLVVRAQHAVHSSAGPGAAPPVSYGLEIHTTSRSVHMHA